MLVLSVVIGHFLAQNRNWGRREVQLSSTNNRTEKGENDNLNELKVKLLVLECVTVENLRIAC